MCEERQFVSKVRLLSIQLSVRGACIAHSPTQKQAKWQQTRMGQTRILLSAVEQQTETIPNLSFRESAQQKKLCWDEQTEHR